MEDISETNFRLLPWSEFPASTLMCPFCDRKQPFKNAGGLMGHAFAKHSVKWEKPDYESMGTMKRQLLRRGISTVPSEQLTMLPWQMLGISMVELQGYTYEEAAKQLGRRASAHKLQQIANAPLGLAYRDKLQQTFEDPAAAAKALFTAQSLDVSVSYLTAMEWAKEAHDYDAYHRMAKDLLKATGTLEPDVGQGATTINIHLGERGSLEPIEVHADYTVIVPEDDD